MTVEETLRRQLDDAILFLERLSTRLGVVRSSWSHAEIDMVAAECWARAQALRKSLQDEIAGRGAFLREDL
jgi:hypothetical protein